MNISQHEDKSFKILIDLTMPDFLKSLGIEEEIVIPLPTELVATDCVNRRLDYCGMSRDHEIINVEFQSTVLTKEDEFRILDYASSLCVKYKMPVKTYIISTAEDTSRKIEKWHHNDVFTIYVISLKDKDGLKSLNRIKSKIENNETLNGEDISLLISIVFMDSDMSESDLLFRCAELTNEAKFENEFLRDRIKAIQMVLADKFIKDENVFKRFERVVNMESSALASIIGRLYGDEIKAKKEEGRLLGIGQGVELGIEEGDEKRAISVARWMLSRKMSVEDISEATELPIDKIRSLI